MIIKNAKVVTHDMQLKEPWAIAGHVHDSIKNTFITLEDSEGNIGIGSCATQNDSEESVKECFDILESFSSSLVGKELGLNENTFGWIASELPLNTEANAAVDIAIHDLWAKREGKTLVDALGKKHQSFDTSITIGVASLEKTIEMAKKHIDNGFSILKIKIGDCVEEDIELKEFSDEIEDCVIEEFKKVGLDTAKSVLELEKVDLMKRTDLEDETVDEVLRILKEEFEE